MVKKQNQIIFLICISFIGYAQSYSLDKFNDSLEKYKPNAPWIMPKLIRLPVDKFIKGFETVLYKLTVDDNRHDYFDISKENFNKDAYWAQCWWQCAVFEIFLNNIYINLKTKKFFLDEAEIDRSNEAQAQAIKKGLVPVLAVFDQLEVPDEEHSMLFYFLCILC